MLSKKEMTKCEIINKIMELVPGCPKGRLWALPRDRLMKMLKKKVERKEVDRLK